MELGTIYESASELKNLLHHRSDLAALEQNLNSLLRQLHVALQLEDTDDGSGFNRLAGVIFKFFEGSQSASTDFMKLWEITTKVKYSIYFIRFLLIYSLFRLILIHLRL